MNKNDNRTTTSLRMRYDLTEKCEYALFELIWILLKRTEKKNTWKLSRG